MAKQLKKMFGVWIAVISLCLVLGMGTALAGTHGAEPKVNINTAPSEVLQTLPGIGPVLAEAIIAYRTATPFASIEDIKKVSGIGDATFEKLKDLITIE